MQDVHKREEKRGDKVVRCKIEYIPKYSRYGAMRDRIAQREKEEREERERKRKQYPWLTD